MICFTSQYHTEKYYEWCDIQTSMSSCDVNVRFIQSLFYCSTIFWFFYMCIFLCDLVMIILLSFVSLRLLLMCFQSGLSFLFYRSFNSLYLFWMERHFYIIQLIVQLMFWSLWHCNFYSCDKKNVCLCVKLVALMLIWERKERHSSWHFYLKFKFFFGLKWSKKWEMIVIKG